MSSVDERIVQMKFDNNQFESGVKQTLDSLDNLKKGLNFQNIESGVNALQKRFSTMGIVGMEVTKRLTNAVIDTGKKLAGVTLGQIKSGGMTRALNIEQARFQLQGLFSDMTDADAQVEKVMGSALNAVKGTAYGLDEAAKSASVLAASGVSMERMEPVLTSIAGAAAMTGRSYEDIGNIYSTVASNGKLMTMQLRQFSAAGLNVSAVLAKHFGKTEEEINKMVEKGQISFDDFSEAMLSFGKQAKRANETFTGSLSNMKAALSRIGAKFATPYLTNMRDIFNALTPAIDEVGEALGPFVEQVEKDMGTVSKSLVNFFNFLSGNTEKHIGPLRNLVKGIVNIIEGLRNSIVPALGSAFKEMFPNATLKNLGSALAHFRTFSTFIESKLIGQTENLKDGFKGLFTIFKAVGKVLGFLKSIIVAVTAPFGGLINIIGSFIGIIGRGIQRLYNFINGSELLSKVANSIISGLGKASQAIHDFVTSSKTLNFVNSIIGGVATGLSYLGKGISALFEAFKNSSLFDKLVQGVAKIKEALGGIGSGSGFKIDFDGLFAGMFSGLDKFAEKFRSFIEAIRKLDFRKIINTGLIGGVVASFVQLSKAIDMFIDRTVVGKDKGLRLASTLHAKLIDMSTWMDKNFSIQTMKAKALLLLSMAAAMAVFAIAVNALGKMDTESLIKGLVGVGLLFEIMTSSLNKLTSAVTAKTSSSLIKVSIALILISVAIKSLSKSVVRLAELEWGQLLKGLLGVAVLLTGLNKFLKASNFEGLSISKGVGLILIASAIKGMSKSVERLGNLNVKQLVKGLLSVSVLLAAIAGFTRLVGSPKHMVSMGAGMILLATSMIIFSSAVKKLGDLKADEISQGLFSLAIVLGLLTAAVKLMPGAKALAIGAALVVMSVGLLAISGALKILSTISSEGILVGLAGIAGSLASLGILASVVNPVKLIAASAGIVIFAAGIGLLTPTLLAFSKISLAGIGKSLLMLAGVLTVFGVGALLLTPVIPMMLLLGAAILVLGAGVTVTAAGLMLLAAAFAALAVSAAAGAAALVAAVTVIITGIVTMIPIIGAAIGEAVLNFIATIANGAAGVAEAATKLGLALLTALGNLIPAIVNTGLRLIVGLMQGINANIGAIASLAIQIVGNFILGIASGIGTIIQAGIALMIAFINGLAQGIRDNTDKVIAAAKNMMSAVVEAILTVLQELLGKIPVIGDEISDALESAKEGVQDFFDVEEAEKMSAEYMAGIEKGINKGSDGVGRSSKKAGEKAKQSTKEGMAGMDVVAQSGVDDLVTGLNNGQIPVGNAADALGGQIPEELKPYMDQLNSTGAAGSINLANGMTSKTEDVKKAAQTVRSVSSGELRAAARDASTSGSTVSSNYANSMSANQSQAKTAGAQVAKASTTEIKTAEKSASASGKSAGGSFSSSLGSPTNINSTRKSARELAYTASVSVSAYNSSFVTTGNNMAAGLESGFRTRMTRTIATIAAKAREAAQAANKGAEVRSPSRITMKTGRFIAEGLSYGMKKRMPYVLNAMSDMGESAADSVTSAMSTVYDLLNSELDASPRITPVLDLSKVNNGVNSLNRILDTRSISANVGYGISGMVGASTQSVNRVTNDNSTQTYNVNVYGTAGQDVNQLADAVVDRIIDVNSRKAAMMA